MEVGHLGDLNSYVSSTYSDSTQNRRKRGRDTTNLESGSHGFSASGVSVAISNKRQKRDDTEFKPGNIKTVAITNFTTYNYAEFSLSPNLNMIIGPNGTGKSTLVAAICVGLGGKLDLIKRQSLKSMVKAGRDNSKVVITIVDTNGQPLKISREFDGSSSSWKMNDKKTTEKAVVSKVKDLNIQLDNLCHFLPQERVAEFAGLTPEKLLLETQRTLDTGALFKMHQNLIQLDEAREVSEKELTEVEVSLEKYSAEEKRLAEEVQRVHQYNEKAKELRFHKLLLPYAVAEEEKANRKKLKALRDSAKEKVDQLDSKKKGLDSGLRDIEGKIASISRDVSRARGDLERKEVQDRELAKQFKDSQELLDRRMEDLAKLKVSKDHTRAEIEMLDKELDELRKKRDTDTDLNALKDLRGKFSASLQEENRRLNALTSRIEELKESINRLENSRNSLQIELKQEETRLNSKDRLQKLRTDMSGGGPLNNAFHLHKELHSNYGSRVRYFECPVVTCELKPQFRNLAGVAERIIGMNNLIAVTFPTDKDFDSIPRELFNKFNSPTRIVKETASPPQISQEVLEKEYGFMGYLSDCFQGPPEVLNMLKVNCKFHLIPYARELSTNQIQKILKLDRNGRVPFLRFVVGDELFTLSVSKYGSRQVVHSSEKITFSRFFGKNTAYAKDSRKDSAEKIDRLKDQMASRVTDMENSKKELQEANEQKNLAISVVRQLDSEIKTLKPAITERQVLENKIEVKEDMVRDKRASLNVDETGKIASLQRRIMRDHIELSKQFDTIEDECQKTVELAINIDKLLISQAELQNREVANRRLIDEVEKLRSHYYDQYMTAREKYQNSRESEAAKQIRKQKQEYTEEEDTELAILAKNYLDEGLLTPAYVSSRINLIEDELSMMTSADRTSIERLKEVEKQIEILQKQLPHLEREKITYDTRIRNIQKEWEPKLSNLIFKISRSFKKKFRSVASDGEVQLKKASKFKKWRLEILVKFREESEMKVLDRQSQSGGERAVATIFFVMALQGLTKAPLRIVDEINQGMDPKNEKTAHRFLVHTACKKSDSQYFLVTPKLLTGLYYHPNMKVHCIYTGPGMDPLNPSEKDFMDFTSQKSNL